MSDTDLLIEIPDDEAPKGEADTNAGKSGEDVGAKSEPVKAQEGIEDLKRQLAEAAEAKTAEVDARRRAEADALRAREEATKSKTEREASEYETVVTAISATNQEAELATREYEEALAAGEFRKAAEAQRKMARAEARLVDLEGGKSAIEAQQKAAPARRDSAESETRATASADPVDDYISKFSPRSQSWLRQHRDVVTDNKKNHRLIAAHNDALAEDHIPDSDAYFDFIERRLGMKTDPAEAGATETRETNQKRTPPMASAPVSRDVSASPSNGQMKPSQVQLRPNEQAAATDGTHVWGSHDLAAGRIKDASFVGQPIGRQEMARRKLKMQQSGLYDRSFTEQ